MPIVIYIHFLNIKAMLPLLFSISNSLFHSQLRYSLEGLQAGIVSLRFFL